MTNRQRLALANRVQRRIQLYYYSLREAGGKEESGGIRKNKTFAPCTVVDEPGADQAAVDHR